MQQATDSAIDKALRGKNVATATENAKNSLNRNKPKRSKPKKADAPITFLGMTQSEIREKKPTLRKEAANAIGMFLTSGIKLDAINKVAEYAFYVVADGAITFKSFAKQMKEDLGENVVPHLKGIWEGKVGENEVLHNGKAIKQWADEAAAERKKKNLPQQIANRLENALLGDEVSQAEKDVLDNMISLLGGLVNDIKQGKESKANNRNFDLLLGALQNKKAYQEIWQKAEQILKERYGETAPDFAEQINDFFDNNSDRLYSDKLLYRIVRKGLQNLGINISELLDSDVSDLAALTDDMVADFLEGREISEEVEIQLFEEIDRGIAGLINAKREAMLKAQEAKLNNLLDDLALPNVAGRDIDALTNGKTQQDIETLNDIANFVFDGGNHTYKSFSRKMRHFLKGLSDKTMLGLWRGELNGTDIKVDGKSFETRALELKEQREKERKAKKPQQAEKPQPKN